MNGIVLETYSFAAPAPGPKLFVMAALHGNEYPGTLGAQAVIKALTDNPALLKCGTITLLPVANPMAYADKIRYHATNPNRIFKRHSVPVGYEEQLVTQLCDYIDGCDVLLDIHSFTAPSPAPFIFINQTDAAHMAYAEALAVPYILTGWSALVDTVDDSETYAGAQGKLSLTLECGQQDDPASPKVAAAAIWRAMLHFGLIDALPASDIAMVESCQLRLQTRIVKERDGALAPNLMHLQPVAADVVLARYHNGGVIIAPQAATVILPKENALIGDEWLYLAT